MRIHALKYLLIFIVPGLFTMGLVKGGSWTFAVPAYSFALIPLFELFFKPDPENAGNTELALRKRDRLYDLLLYLIVPATYGSLLFFLYAITNQPFSGTEIAGLTLSLGIILGGMGINVGHELGHRRTKFEQTLSKTLLLSSLYMHFFIEHNRGHHSNVGTPQDPASAQKGQSVYGFWMQSLLYSYLSAWKIEAGRLERKGKPFCSWHNEMIGFQVVQIALVSSIFVVFGLAATLLFLAAAVVGMLLLETVNYIEHYGLRRKRVTEKRYERVQPHHSWNSDHVLGRMMLFELSRHSDHHYRASKKYQLLESQEGAAQMPTGYPGMMMLSLLPPLWFKVMDHRIPGSEQG